MKVFKFMTYFLISSLLFFSLPGIVDATAGKYAVIGYFITGILTLDSGIDMIHREGGYSKTPDLPVVLLTQGFVTTAYLLAIFVNHPGYPGIVSLLVYHLLVANLMIHVVAAMHPEFFDLEIPGFFFYEPENWVAGFLCRCFVAFVNLVFVILLEGLFIPVVIKLSALF